MSKKIKNFIIIFTVFISVFVIADFVLAEVDVGVGYGQNIGLGETDPRTVAVNIIRIALGFLGIIAVGLIIYGGWLYMTSEGNAEKVEKAKKLLTGAIIGLIIILSAFAIVSFVLNKLSEAVTPYMESCSPIGATQSCGSCLCGVISQGTRTCQASGYWGSCAGLVCASCGPVSPVSCDGNTMELGCQADNTACADGQYCDAGACICKDGGGYGDDCDSDIGTAACQTDDNLCGAYLHCDIEEGCICLGNPVIENVSPTGGFCDGDINLPCQSNGDCSGLAPSTCNTTTPNGAVGNLVAVRGRYFQEYSEGTSTISFWNGTGFIEAQLASSANPNCDTSWTDSQVVVVVPNGAAKGPIKITAENGEDATNDNIGPSISDFLVNSISRPGLCKLNPNHGIMNDTVAYYGINLLSNDVVNFGDYTNHVNGLNFIYNGAMTVRADVPNIKVGKTTSFIKSNNNTISNYLNFTKEAEPYSGPYITSFDPVQGTFGQYVTIYGTGFKNIQGTSQVYFGNINGIKANYEFPDVCADSFWSDSQVIIKVPEGLAGGNYTITMTIGSWTIDTGSTTPSSFKVDSGLTLTPSLCKIDPVMGQNNDLISLWGEYFDTFDNINSKVRFHLNKDQGGVNIGFWGLDPDVTAGIKPYKVTTTIQQNAISGPVRIVKGSSGTAGNGLNFNIGTCTKDEHCGTGNVCCPGGTFKGRCKSDIDECYALIASSVYEWDFSTGSTTPPSTPAESCLGWALQTGHCAENEFCPNSKGQCSLGRITSAGVCGNNYCSDRYGSQCGTNCVFDALANKCRADSGALTTACSVYEGASFAIGGDSISLPAGYTGAQCRQVGANYYWQINPGLKSCPNSNWELAVNGWCTLVDPALTPSTPQVCNPCSSGFDCEAEGAADNQGKCYIGGEVCPAGSSCNSDICEYNTPINQCECCCRISNASQDCCATLSCTGNCGSDAASVDTNTYGHCSGCRIDSNGDGAISATEQILSDQACNCTTSTGKFCDVNVGDDNDGDGYPDGICSDCNQLSTTNLCSFHHTTCCVDAMNFDNCKGESGFQELEGAANATDYYCAYYRCDENFANGCYGLFPDYIKIASSTGRVFTATSTCEAKCIAGPAYPIGAECKKTLDPPMCQTGLDSCGEYLDCLDKSGSDCRCCCDPGDDKCGEIVTGDATTKLKCQSNIEPCTAQTDERGLCCGCGQDSHCGDIEAAGCGSDTCCRTRPYIENIMPANNTDSVCRNAQISATFDQKMDINSFTGNVIVIGDYEEEMCPGGTVYLAFNGELPVKRNIFVKIFNKVIRTFKNKFISIFRGKSVLAELSDPDHNYCAIEGVVSGEQTANKKTKLTFSPNKLMAASRKYYVIIKGDKDLDSNSGVLSHWDVGMNATSSPISDASEFNGLTFTNSYIWQFTTYSTQYDATFCQINDVEIEPNPYLFQTTKNDLNENDYNPDDPTFDTAKDSDKVFVAKASASEMAGRQIIVPVEGRWWDWIWSIDNRSIVATTSAYMFPANVPFDSASSSQLIIAQSGVTDGKTFINATANVSGGGSKTGTSTVRVFVCENPWPPIRDDGTWAPWQDTAANCTISDQGCFNTNYELYYCRDSGGFGTADDLPAILSDDTIIRGANLECTDSQYNCIGQGVGDICGEGFCEYSLLKESYFFREELPNASGINLATTTNSSLAQGNKAALIWSGITPPAGEILDKYNIYYGINSGSYSYSTSTPRAHSPVIPFIVDNLTNNTTYYFVITAEYASGAESEYSNEVSATPKDTESPDGPVIDSITPKDSKVDVVWEDNSHGDAISFRIYYKAKSGICDESVKFGASAPAMPGATAINTTSVSGLMNGVEYCFGIVGYDIYGNESDIDYESAIPFSSVSGFSVVKIGDQEIKLSWEAADGAGGYNIYYGLNPGNYSNHEESVMPGTAVSPQIISGLTNGLTYYFAVKSVNADWYENIDFSNEVSARPFSFPNNLSIVGGNGEAELTWSCDGVGVAEYNIYYGLAEGGPYTQEVPTSTPGTAVNPQIINNLINNSTYYFIVKSISLDGSESNSTEEKNATPED